MKFLEDENQSLKDQLKKAMAEIVALKEENLELKQQVKQT